MERCSCCHQVDYLFTCVGCDRKNLCITCVTIGFHWPMNEKGDDLLRPPNDDLLDEGALSRLIQDHNRKNKLPV